MKEKILVVDDDKSMVNMIKDVLEMEGYAVTTAFDGEQALKQVQKQSDIILLDINLPKMDGIEVCEKIRDCVHCPILFLSARIEEKDRIIGLKAGGDDYIVKPFSIGELLARIEAHLRREARIQGKTEFRYDNDLIIDLNSRKVSFDNQVIELTKSEFDIVAFLCGLSRNHFYTFHNICFCNFAYARHEEKHLQFYSYETDQQPELCSGQIYCWNLNGLTLCCYTNSDCRCCRCKCRKQLWIQNKPLGYLGQYHNV